MVIETPVRSDRVRQVVVTVSEVACVLGTLVGVGVFGGAEVAQAGGGALSAEATLIAPATQAFSIWSVIYVGLAVYTVWQWLPAQAAAERHRRIGWLAAASMLLNAGWLLVVQAGWLWASVVVIIALVVVLVADHPATERRRLRLPCRHGRGRRHLRSVCGLGQRRRLRERHRGASTPG